MDRLLSEEERLFHEMGKIVRQGSQRGASAAEMARTLTGELLAGCRQEPPRDARRPHVAFLDQQYRMTPSICRLVSETVYEGLLKTGRDGFDGKFKGQPPTFIDTSGVWDDRNYSVDDQSYFHYCTIPIVHAIADWLERDVLMSCLYCRWRDDPWQQAGLTGNYKRE